VLARWAFLPARYLPGTTDTTTLEAASTLCGDASWKLRGQDHASRHPVATPDMIRQLPAGTALVIRGGNAPSSPGCPAPGTTPLPSRPPPHPGPGSLPALDPSRRRLGIPARPRPRTGFLARGQHGEHRRPRGRPRAARARLAARHQPERTVVPLEPAMTPDPVSTALDQLAACRAAISRLDAREAAHYGELSDQAARLAGLVTTVSRTLAEDTAAFARLDDLDRQVTALTGEPHPLAPDLAR